MCLHISLRDTEMTTCTKLFEGKTVFLSPDLVPPELFDSVHRALKQSGADVFLNCDPSRNAPNDYHVISSSDHEKFKYLRSKGCNLLGPRCVLSCSDERIVFPKQVFTCCLTLQGFQLLASGFCDDEMVKIKKLVISMGGVLKTKVTSRINFFVVKNVLASQYKLSLKEPGKTIVTVDWLYQCSIEHRIVPTESYTVPTFSGLTICVTGILLADERKRMENIIVRNGGKYSTSLTKLCTHLICEAPEGDKYKYALHWGHIHVVSREWFVKSVARSVCLNEDCYPVRAGSISLIKTGMSLSTKHSEDSSIRNSQSDASFVKDSQSTLSQNVTSLDTNGFNKEEVIRMPANVATNEINNEDKYDSGDSEKEDVYYLHHCRMCFVGFNEDEKRKLGIMAMRGGSIPLKNLNKNLSHIVVGNPSEREKEVVRAFGASGSIDLVGKKWLETCYHEKKEVPVTESYDAYNSVLPKGSTRCRDSKKASDIDPTPLRGWTDSVADSCVPPAIGISVEEDVFKPRSFLNGIKLSENDTSTQPVQTEKLPTVFNGKIFCFSNSFPEERRGEIVEWVNQGGGEFVNDIVMQKADFIVECHGVMSRSADISAIYVSAHWIKSCLEDGCFLDIGSHILYSPLHCEIPLPGFESLRLCVSQYEEKEKLLLKNLCFVLKVKYCEKLTRKVTHLLCMHPSGSKYEAACKWGIQSVTSHWIYACIKQNGVVDVDGFCPREETEEKETLESMLSCENQKPPLSLKNDIFFRREEKREVTDCFGEQGCKRNCERKGRKQGKKMKTETGCATALVT